VSTKKPEILSCYQKGAMLAAIKMLCSVLSWKVTYLMTQPMVLANVMYGLGQVVCCVSYSWA
jgi:hypothetical protein